MFKIKKTPVCVDAMGDPIRIGDWKREKELGSGAFGVVSLWINRVNGDRLAIKKCKWNLESQLTKKQRERWSLEVQMMQQIENENIVSYRRMPEVLENALWNSNRSRLPILSMEYCPLGNLRSMLSKPENSCGFHEKEVLNILKDVSNALTYLHHRSITHRDFKPENIVLQNCNTRQSGILYKVIDLGYAKELNSATVSFVGTLQYLAPEMFEKQTYNKSVDYWSLGITAFEIICGVRPFLPPYTPVQSFEYIKKKDSDVICIQMTHTGDIKWSKELLKENHINTCLKENIEKWLKSLLQFDPDKRGLIENNNIDVFQSLQGILSKRVITVFSIYTFEFYSYEINDSTLYSTLQDWIARDIKIKKSDQYLVASKISDSNYALDYYDERNSDAMLFVFKKDARVSERVSAALPFPKLIKIMFEKIKTEFKFGSLRLLHAQVIYFISQEIKHFVALMNGIYLLYGLLNNIYAKENKLFTDLRSSLQSLLSEIEFYNDIETSLCTKVYKDTNNVKLNTYLLEYEDYMHQLKEIIDTTNALSVRHRKIIMKNPLLRHACSEVLRKLKRSDFKSLTEQAVKMYEEIIEQKPVTNLTASGEILKIVSSTLKIRDKILMDKYLLHFLKGATSYWKELNKLISCMTALKINLSAIKEKLRQNNIKRLDMLQDRQENKDSHGARAPDGSGHEIIKQNVCLRYDMQELIDSNIFKYKNGFNKTVADNSLGFIIENGVE